MTTGRSEDDAWRSIVDNYGDRPELDEEPVAEAGPDTGPDAGPAVADVPDEGPGERFVPPVPPPAPPLPLPKRLAWLAVLGSPAVLVVALLVSFELPRLLGYALVAAFLCGFGHLVWTMQRSGERNPWDDGAQV